MPRKKQSKGICAFCGHEVAKTGATKHLGSCAQLLEVIAKAGKDKTGHEPLYRLRVQSKTIPEYWLNIEMRGSERLECLDKYLRAIWLECCGHQSQFSFGGWEGEDVSMTRRLADVLEAGEELTHVYDSGKASVTLIKAEGIREGIPLTENPITLLMRNVMPECECMVCKQPASWLCAACVPEKGIAGTLCDVHAKTHPHLAYGDPLTVMNSPRMGACAYKGPAEPPY